MREKIANGGMCQLDFISLILFLGTASLSSHSCTNARVQVLGTPVHEGGGGAGGGREQAAAGARLHLDDQPLRALGFT